jgi:hypothetical protein
MSSRATIIAALLMIEVAIVGETLVALRGKSEAPAYVSSFGEGQVSGANLVEGGAHQIFDARTHPALTVDIGYADLTIRTTNSARIDISVSASKAFGIFRTKAPIVARADGARIDVAMTGGRGWSLGDNRMVTVLVPPQTQVTVVNAGDIKANGLRAQAEFNSIGRGSVTVEDYQAPVLVASSNGRIALREIVARRLDALSSDGRVDGTELQVRDGRVESDGRVTLGFAAGADTLVNAQTRNGSVRLWGFGAGARAAAGHTSSDGGDGDSGNGDSSAQTVRVGNGNGRLDVRASDGNINLDQQG